MLKLILAICVVFAACHAEPLVRGAASRQRYWQRGTLARQEQAPTPAEPAPTGYPAAGVTPEVPFELPAPTTTTAKPDNTYLPPDAAAEPDNTYLPPDNTNTAADEEPQEVPVPDDEPAPVDEPLPEEDIEESSGAADAEDDANVRQQEDAEEDVLVAVAEDGSVISVSTSFNENDPQPARLVYQRFPQAQRRRQSAPARLRFMPARYVLV